MIGADDLVFLDEGIGEDAPPGSLNLPAAVERLERSLIRRALAETGGKRTEAARRLGIHRQLLYEKLRRYGFEPSAMRTEGVANPDENSA